MSWEHFDGLESGVFVQSQALARNWSGGGFRWRMGYVAVPLQVIGGPTVPVGPMSTLFELVRPTALAPLIRKREIRHRDRIWNAKALGSGLNSGNQITVPLQVTGTPYLRFWFRVRGVFETLGWGQEYIVDRQNGDLEFRGHDATIFCPLFQTVNQVETWRFIQVDGNRDTTFAVGSSLLMRVNRTAEPSDWDRPGVYYFDRVIAVSGTAAASATFTLASGQFSPSAVPTYGWGSNTEFTLGGSPAGNYPATAGAGVLGNRPNQGTDFSTFIFENTEEFNPRSLYTDFANPHMIRDGGFLAPGGGGAVVPISGTQVVEALFLGAVAEPTLRPEIIIDLTPPRLLSDVDES